MAIVQWLLNWQASILPARWPKQPADSAISCGDLEHRRQLRPLAVSTTLFAAWPYSRSPRIF